MRYLALGWLIGALLAGCHKAERKQVIEEVNLGGEIVVDAPEKLSQWNLFREPLRKLDPMPGIVPYDLNTPLFSDYALKKRFVKVPEGQLAEYHPTEVMAFPEGTILIKNFYYPADFRAPDTDLQLMETRLLINEGSEWMALTYIWDEDQTDAWLEIAGRSLPVSWKDKDGELKNVRYSVPNLVQCKSCHDKSGLLVPIGPTARQLNRDHTYKSGTANQLAQWQVLGMLTSLPSPAEWPMVPVWDDPETGTLNERARAWLEVNCAHCHRAEGPAKNTGLYLTYQEKDPYKLGIHKPPVAAGKGSGGLKYGIIPGLPEQSILIYRMESLDPGVMMPEVGRKINHEEGIQLVKDWIKNME